MRAHTQVYADTNSGGTDAPYLYLSGTRGADGSSGLPAVCTNASLVVDSSVISNEITFVYTVELGDSTTSAVLEVDGRLAIRGGDAPLVDLLGREANVTLPEMGSAESLSAASSVSVDTAEPVVVAVGSSLEGGEYGVGQVRHGWVQKYGDMSAASERGQDLRSIFPCPFIQHRLASRLLVAAVRAAYASAPFLLSLSLFLRLTMKARTVPSRIFFLLPNFTRLSLYG